ncbi:peptidoglycan recognition protein 1-like, partial [Trichogramma pretiosum]|uniref:peptidoglycan recognition protein 1-like n=1 Tax=Trichogramma pretiosum TaxID=7493 RepID=UPI000C71A688
QSLSTWKNKIAYTSFTFYETIDVSESITAPEATTTTTSTSPIPSSDSTVVSRSEWQAEPPSRPLRPVESEPLAYVVAGTTDISGSSCLGLLWCSHAPRQLQRLARLRGSADLEHNFLVGGDGIVYEGRGWAVEGEHTLNELDARSLGVGFFSDRTTEPVAEQFRALEELLDYGVSMGHLAPDYRLTDRCKLRRDKSCSAFTKELKKWRHWTDEL